jgi:FkbM family methyltransferase
MKQHQGIWLPDHELHFIEWMDRNGEMVDGRGTYQIKKLRAAMEWVKQFRVAVDVGAHCGLWSMHLATRFGDLHAFEPVEEHRACWWKNLDGRMNVHLHPCALGEKEGGVSMNIPHTSSGGTTVAGTGPIPLERLDAFGLNDVDFIKLDCEGYELFALRGAEQMLLRCRPCVIVEQKPGRAQKFGLGETDAVSYLEGLGAKRRQELSGDFILSWDEN